MVILGVWVAGKWTSHLPYKGIWHGEGAIHCKPYSHLYNFNISFKKCISHQENSGSLQGKHHPILFCHNCTSSYELKCTKMNCKFMGSSGECENIREIWQENLHNL